MFQALLDKLFSETVDQAIKALDSAAKRLEKLEAKLIAKAAAKKLEAAVAAATAEVHLREVTRAARIRGKLADLLS